MGRRSATALSHALSSSTNSSNSSSSRLFTAHLQYLGFHYDKSWGERGMTAVLVGLRKYCHDLRVLALGLAEMGRRTSEVLHCALEEDAWPYLHRLEIR